MREDPKQPQLERVYIELEIPRLPPPEPEPDEDEDRGSVIIEILN